MSTRSYTKLNPVDWPVAAWLILLLLLRTGTVHAAAATPPTAAPTTGQTLTTDPDVTETVGSDLVYREVLMRPRTRSAFHKPEHQDYVDQLYLTLKYAAVYDYRNTVVVEPVIRTPRSRPTNPLELLIEQGYIESALGHDFVLTAGKKRETEGSGFALNPSDLLNQDQDFFDPLYRREGQVFTRLAWRPRGYKLGIGFVPERGAPFGAGKAWLTGATTLAGADVTTEATFQRSEKSDIGLSVARFFTDSWELHVDGRYQARQRDIADRPERAYSSYHDDDASYAYVAGTRFVLTPKRTAIAEIVTEQAGLMPDEMQNYFTFVRGLDESDGRKDLPTRLIGRHYVYLGYQDGETLGKTSFGLSALANRDDRSLFSSLDIKHPLSRLATLEISALIFDGHANTEFGEAPFKSATYLQFEGRF